ncbi:MAG: type I pullulanase [Acholeplasmataceae bacterium]
MRKIISLILVFVSSFIFMSLIHATEATKLIIHYYRYDGGVGKEHVAWIWQHSPAETEYKFDHVFTPNEDPEMENWLTLEVDITIPEYKDMDEAGIIIKNGKGWDGVVREPGGDRIIDFKPQEVIDPDTGKTTTIGGVVDGKLEVYFVQASPEFYYRFEDVHIKNVIFDSYFTNDLNIRMETSAIPLSYEVFNGEESILTRTPTTKDFTIDLSSVEIDISNHYYVLVTFDDGEAKTKVSLSGLYQNPLFESIYHYDGELGALYKKESTTFKVWSPHAEEMSLLLYNNPHRIYNQEGKEVPELGAYKVVKLTRGEKGVFQATVDGDLHGKFYIFESTVNGTKERFVDPYAKSVGPNGERGMIVDFSRLNPQGWTYDTRPDTIKKYTDYILYETHIKDLTTHATWNGPSDKRGTFLGLTVSNTTFTKDGITVKTGLDHISELGVNAVHLLPVMDSDTTDETKINNEEYMKQNGYNWGYMTKNFNALEGAYSTNPFSGELKINEFKELIMAFHEKGIRVVLDVVYNHTYQTEGSHFQIMAPGYFYRRNDDGSYSNGSGTGNETASEMFMFRKFMIDSILFWAKEYNISGFRFDLMGLHDVETMNQIRAAVNSVDPTIIIYGEPWKAADSPLPFNQQAVRDNMSKMTEVASFNDVSREPLKQFSYGDKNWEYSDRVKYALTGASLKYNGSSHHHQAYHNEPYRLINYTSAHDNSTLRDEYFRTYGVKDDKQLERLSMQANGLVFTSQGIPFIQGGTELMLSKKVPDWVKYSFDNRVHETYKLSDNSYNLPEEVNQFNYENKVNHFNVFDYYRQLIAIRRTFDHLTMANSIEIDHRLTIHQQAEDFFTYLIKGHLDEPEMIIIQTGGTGTTYTLNKDYYMLANGVKANVYGLEKSSGTLTIQPHSTIILIEQSPTVSYDPHAKPINFELMYGMNFDRGIEEPPKQTNHLQTIVLIASSVIVVVGVTYLVIKLRSNKEKVDQ